MKRSLILAGLIGFSCLSATCVSQASDVIHGGIFLGAGASVTGVNYKYSQAPGPYLKHNGSQYKIRPDFFAGYGATTASNNVYLGFEVGMSLGSTPFHKTASTMSGSTEVTSREAKQGNVYYVDFLPGFLFGSDSHSMVYGILGGAMSKFTLEQPQPAFAFNTQRTGYGYRVGVGYDYALVHNFSVGLKFVHSGYQNIKIKNSTIDYGLDPSNNTISAGFSYTFNFGNGNGGDQFLN